MPKLDLSGLSEHDRREVVVAAAVFCMYRAIKKMDKVVDAIAEAHQKERKMEALLGMHEIRAALVDAMNRLAET